MIEENSVGKIDSIPLTKTAKTPTKKEQKDAIYFQYQNQVNSSDLETQIEGINGLNKFWDKFGPMTSIPGGRLLGILFDFAFHFENEEIRRISLHDLAFLALANHTNFPVQQLKDPEIYESIFSMLSSKNLLDINDGILLFYGLCVDEDVNRDLHERGILEILINMNNNTFAPILMVKLISLIFPEKKEKIDLTNPETAAKVEHFSPILAQIPAFVSKFLDSSTPIVVQKSVNLLNIVKKLGIEIDPEIILSRINKLLQCPLAGAVASTLKFLKNVPALDQELFETLISIALMRSDIAGKVFKYLASNIESLDEESYGKFYEVLLQSVEQKSVKFGEKAIPYVVELMTSGTASDFRALDCCLQYLDSPNKDISTVSLQGIVKVIQLAEEGGFKEELNDHLCDYEDQIEALTGSEDQEISELGIQILDLIK